MIFGIEDYLKDKAKELSFLTIKGDAQMAIKDYTLPAEGLDVPLLTEELAASIKAGKGDEIKIASIIKGMIFTIGIDYSFKHRDEYIRFLKSANPKIEDYILYQSAEFGEENTLDEIIFLKALVTINYDNNRGLLGYGISLINYAEVKLKSKGREKQYMDFVAEGRNALEELLNRGFEEPLTYYNLAYIYKVESKYIKSKLMAEAFLKSSQEELLKDNMIILLGEIRDLAIFEEGYEAILAGEPYRGLPLLEELINDYPKWWNLQFFLGLGYRQAGDFDAALKHFKEVLEIINNQLDTLVEIGLCYYSLGDIEEAIEYFLLALEIGGDNSEVLCNLAVAYLEAGNHNLAMEAIDRSLSLNPEDEVTKIVYDAIIQAQKNN